MDGNIQKCITTNVSELSLIGVSSQSVIQLFLDRTGKEIKLDDLIKVSTENEGKSINFQTWDGFSIIVSPIEANGSFNKIN